MINELCNKKRPSTKVLNTTLAIFFYIYASSTMACGTVQWTIEGIYGKGPMSDHSKTELFSMLAKDAGPCQQLSNSHPKDNQERLVHLLMNKKFDNYLAKFGQNIFLNFNCLSTQKNHSDYSKITSSYSVSTCPSGNYFFVTSQNGGNLRSSPKISNNKLTTLPEGAELREISRINNWIKVEVIRYNPFFTPPCKYSTPCKQGYVHESLIN